MFVLEARHFPETATLVEAIYESLLPEDFRIPKEDLQKYMEDHQDNILFIIDGYDEFHGKHVPIIKLIQGKILPHSSVVITSRPVHMMPLLKFFDSFFVIVGYAQTEKLNFIQKFAEQSHAESHVFKQLIERLALDEAVKDISRNPLNLCLLCMIVEENQGCLPESKTGLYQEVTDLLLHKCKVRDICDDLSVDLRTHDLAKLAYGGLAQGKYNFDSSLLGSLSTQKELESLGFFSKEISLSKLRPMVNYAFTHKSFLEFFTAVHIVNQDADSRQKMYDESLGVEEFHNVWPFVCGLLCDEESLLGLFTAISSTVSHEYNLVKKMGTPNILQQFHQYLLFECFQEINFKMKAPLIATINQCIPDQIKFMHMLASGSAYKGFVRVVEMLHQNKIQRSFQLLLSGDLFNDSYNQMLSCLKEILRYNLVSSVALYGVLSIHQVLKAAELFKVGQKYSPVTEFQLKFLGGASDKDENYKINMVVGKYMKSMHIYECCDVECLNALLENLMDSTTLETLCIRCCTVGNDTLRIVEQLLSTLPNLTKFNFTEKILADAYTCNEYSVSGVLTALGQCTTLKSLALSGVQELSKNLFPIQRQSSSTICIAMQDIARKNPLEAFSISSTVLDSSLLESLEELFVKRQLTKLVIQRCHILDPESFTKFIGSVKDTHQLLTLNIKDTTIPEQCFKAFVDLLAENPQIKRILFSQLTTDNVIQLCESLNETSELEDITLYSSGLGVEGSKVLGTTLPKLSSLQKLRIGACNFARHYAVPLFQGIAQCKSLTHLHVTRGGLNTTYLPPLIGCVAQNHSITRLDLAENYITTADMSSLYEMLTERPMLQMLDLSDNEVTKDDPEVQLLKKRVLQIKVNLFGVPTFF